MTEWVIMGFVGFMFYFHEKHCTENTNRILHNLERIESNLERYVSDFERRQFKLMDICASIPKRNENEEL